MPLREKYDFHRAYLSDGDLTDFAEIVVRHFVSPEARPPLVQSVFADEAGIRPGDTSEDAVDSMAEVVIARVPYDVIRVTGDCRLHTMARPGEISDQMKFATGADHIARLLLENRNFAYRIPERDEAGTLLILRDDRTKTLGSLLGNLSGLGEENIDPVYDRAPAGLDNLRALAALGHALGPQDFMEAQVFNAYTGAAALFLALSDNVPHAEMTMQQLRSAQLVNFFMSGNVPEPVFGFLTPDFQDACIKDIPQAVYARGQMDRGAMDESGPMTPEILLRGTVRELDDFIDRDNTPLSRFGFFQDIQTAYFNTFYRAESTFTTQNEERELMNRGDYLSALRMALSIEAGESLSLLMGEKKLEPLMPRKAQASRKAFHNLMRSGPA